MPASADGSANIHYARPSPSAGPSGRTGSIVSNTVPSVIAEALMVLAERGWASLQGSLQDVTDYARKTGWQPVALRQGDGVVTELRAVASSRAHPNSISSRTGMGAQPLHTDGAHLKKPPDLVALESGTSHRAATRLWVAGGSDIPWDDVRHGVFRVSDGMAVRFSVAAADNWLRYDPCCMTPMDERSRRAARFFESMYEDSMRHEWRRSTPEVLLIDNRRTLHAREAVDPADPPRRLTRAAFRRPETR